KFSEAMVEGALAAADAAEIESQDRKVPVHEGIIELINNLVVHVPAELRVRLENDCDRGVPLPGGMITAFDASGRTGEDDFRHWHLNRALRAAGDAFKAPLTEATGPRNCSKRLQFLAGRDQIDPGAGARPSRLGFLNDRRAKKQRFHGCARVRNRRCERKEVWEVAEVLTQRVYLDWNATAPLRPQARAAVLEALDLCGNPSTVHAEGRAAHRLIEQAREEVAALLGAEARNVVFTSGGTEANVLALS